MNRPETQEHYATIRELFRSELLKHFPINLPNNQIGFGFSANYGREIPGSCHLTTKYFSKSKYLEVKKSFASRCKFKLLSNDTCLFVIEKDWKNRDCKNQYPVPIKAVQDLVDDGKQKETVEIFILSTESGNFTKEGSDTLTIVLPNGMKKGYSSGITAYDKELSIKYWLVVW
jgi:hypothetical protein